MSPALRRLYGLVVTQRCLPWPLWKWLTPRFPRLVNLIRHGRSNFNTKEHWDRVWNQKGESETRTYPALFGRIVEVVAPASRMLDVGCGAGVLLGRLRQERGCHVCGYDISPVAIAHLAQLGIDGKTGSLPTIPFPDGTFDVVTATEVLEHLVTPELTLREVVRVLQPPGLFLASVPDHYLSVWDSPEHLQLFDAPRLHALLSRFFQTVHVESIAEQKTSMRHLFAVCRNLNQICGKA